MKACELKVISKSIQICYDNSGNKYDLPIFVINAPERYEVKQEADSNYKGKIVKLKFQYLNHLKEFDLSLDDKVEKAVKLAIAMVCKVEEFDGQVSVLRIVYQGKVFKEDSKLGFYLQTDALVQVFKMFKN